MIDPQTMRVEAFYEVGVLSQPKSLAVAHARREAYMGIGDFGTGTSTLFRVDLSNLDAALGDGQADDLAASVLNDDQHPIEVPFADPQSQPSGRNVSAIALNHGETQLFCVNFNDGTVNQFRLTGVNVTFEQQALFARGQDLTQTFGPNPQSLLVRPGVPGTSFTGPDLFVGTVNIGDPLLQATPGVFTSIDVVKTTE